MLWFVVLAGAVISLTAAFVFDVEDLRLHAILVTLLAEFMGLGLKPEPYQLVYDKVMQDTP